MNGDPTTPARALGSAPGLGRRWRRREQADLELEGGERSDASDRAVVPRSRHDPLSISERERFERAGVDVDHPVVAHAVLRVESELRHAVVRRTRRGENLAHPVRHYVCRAPVPRICEPVTPTESGILHQMKKAAPDKELIAAPPVDDTCACNECPFMRLNSMEKLYVALRDLSPQIEMPEAQRLAALAPIERMLSLS